MDGCVCVGSAESVGPDEGPEVRVEDGSGEGVSAGAAVVAGSVASAVPAGSASPVGSTGSITNPAGSIAEVVPPGSIMSSRRPSGSRRDAPLDIRTWTPSDGPTHAGVVPPRDAPRSPSPLSPSSRSHVDHV